ncbi:hypothetical protein BJ508DRAFT_331819 [Ascobolus immersus RN42]|uniref:Uncharacterized protein n=1 Tax=Ascobolus immersus RN42 TaxID=1160509 RepID=A0A3N4HT67_ASCIM|nr:hypothetical protein BJ508DRAFT_331819 [Ascobolus immersus RN42]
MGQSVSTRKSEHIHIHWGNETASHSRAFGQRRIKFLEAKFPRAYEKRNDIGIKSDINGILTLDLSPQADGDVLWAHAPNGSGSKGRRRYLKVAELGGRELLRIVCESLLVEDPEKNNDICATALRNVYLGTGYSNDLPISRSHRREESPTHHRNVNGFLDLFEAFVTTGRALSCISTGRHPIKKDLESAYEQHRHHLKSHSDTEQAFRFLKIADQIRSRTMFHDFVFPVLSKFEVLFPNYQYQSGDSPSRYRNVEPALSHWLAHYVLDFKSRQQDRKGKYIDRCQQYSRQVDREFDIASSRRPTLGRAQSAYAPNLGINAINDPRISIYSSNYPTSPKTKPIYLVCKPRDLSKLQENSLMTESASFSSYSNRDLPWTHEGSNQYLLVEIKSTPITDSHHDMREHHYPLTMPRITCPAGAPPSEISTNTEDAYNRSAFAQHYSNPRSPRSHAPCVCGSAYNNRPCTCPNREFSSPRPGRWERDDASTTYTTSRESSPTPQFPGAYNNSQQSYRESSNFGQLQTMQALQMEKQAHEFESLYEFARETIWEEKRLCQGYPTSWEFEEGVGERDYTSRRSYVEDEFVESRTGRMAVY